jgi:hypothetical protein
MDFFQTWGHIYIYNYIYIYITLVFLSSEKWAVAARGSSGLVINRCFLEPVPWLCPTSNWWGVWEFPFVRKFPYKCMAKNLPSSGLEGMHKAQLGWQG